MLAYTIRRLLLMIPVVFGVTILMFLMTATNPNGGEIASYLGGGQRISQTQVVALEHRLGLDQPLPVQYIKYMQRLFTGDLGTSFSEHMPVSDAIKERLLPTIILLGTAFLLQELIAIPLGIYAAIRRGSLFDQIFSAISYTLFALPAFWFGLMAIVFIGVDLGWLPFNGMVDIQAAGDDFGTPLYTAYFQTHTVTALIDIARHLALPVIILASSGFAVDSRFMRGQMLEVLNQDYVRTAKAKGLAPRLVIWKHALRNAVLPIITSIGLQIPGLVGGAVVVESIFGWPGMGSLFVNAANKFDYPVVIAIVLMVGILTLVFNLLTDLAYALVDPRIRYG
jgi:peptide/nickel transport system permease protein